MILSYVAELDNLENFVCIVNDMADDVVVVDEQEHEKPKDKGEELVDWLTRWTLQLMMRSLCWQLKYDKKFFQKRRTT